MGASFSFLLPYLGDMVTHSRLSWCKTKVKKHTNQENNAFYRLFLHLIDELKYNLMILNYLRF